MQKQINFKEYSMFTYNNNLFNTKQNNNKHYFILKHFRNFINNNQNEFKNNNLNNYIQLYNYLEKLSNFSIYIKDAKCNYDEILNENDKKLLSYKL
jgi:hypothetical protein